MKVKNLTREQAPAGARLRVTGVARSVAEERGHINDRDRLLGETGTVEAFTPPPISQLHVIWDHKKPGKLMLAGDDEIEVWHENPH